MPATQDDILKAATDLGKLVAAHSATKRYNELTEKLDADRDAQRVLADYSRAIQTVAEKEQSGRPIEVEDKRKLETAQRAVMSHLTLQNLQIAQMAYLDLLRSVDEAIQAQAEPRHAPAPGSSAPAPAPGSLAPGSPAHGPPGAGSGLVT